MYRQTGDQCNHLRLKLTRQIIRQQQQRLNLTQCFIVSFDRTLHHPYRHGSSIDQLNYTHFFSPGIRYDRRSLFKMSFLLNMIYGKLTTIPPQKEDCTGKVVIITGGNGGK